MKVGCIIQGDFRRGTKLILDKLPELFDFTVLSTWDDEFVSPAGNYAVIKNQKPNTPGFTNRNYQRLTTAKGLEAAKAENCDYVLKWRTDMLPTILSKEQLLQWANFSPPINTKSRIVMPAFRNISIDPDTFSTVPDLFAFGHVEEMTRLWDDSGFDYSKEFNMPLEDQEKLGGSLIQTSLLSEFYCAEAELYTIYRSRLSKFVQTPLNHKIIAENYLRLIDYNPLGILWFGPKKGFRSIGQAWEHPWWTENQWRHRSAKIHPFGYQSSKYLGKIKRKLSTYKINRELKRQEKIWLDLFPNVVL